MSKKSMMAVCLCGLVWAGTAQAGFLGNNLELQWLQSGLPSLSPTSVDVTTNPTPASIGGIDLSIGDQNGIGQITLISGNVNPQFPADLSIVDINDTLDPIVGVGGLGNLSFGQNNDGHQYILISGLSGGIENQGIDVQFASTVPEPGAFDLVALGLMILGMTIYQRKHVRA